jgi:ankyrin repeat protein
MVKALAREGADVKAKTDSVKTALYYAKKYDQNEIEKYLESLSLSFILFWYVRIRNSCRIFLLLFSPRGCKDLHSVSVYNINPSLVFK